MNNDTRNTVLRLLADIAPEMDAAALRPDVNFREQLDIDSIDFQNFVVALHKELHVDVPEKDYARLTTLNGCVAYLEAHLVRRP